MAEEGATSIQQLQSGNDNQNENMKDNSREVVQEILNEIEDKNNVQSNHAQQQYNMDSSIQHTSVAPQNEQEAQMYQQQMMQQPSQGLNEMMQQPSQGFNEMMPEYSNMEQVKSRSFTTKLLDNIKSPLIVFAVILLLSFVPTKQFLQKIPKTLSQTGNVTLIGNVVIALLGALLFFVIQLSSQKLM